MSKLTQVHHVETFGLTVPCGHAIVAELGIAGLSAFGGDEHYTIGALCTVDSGGRSILEDLHAYDVGGVDGRKGRDGRDLAVA